MANSAAEDFDTSSPGGTLKPISPSRVQEELSQAGSALSQKGELLSRGRGKLQVSQEEHITQLLKDVKSPSTAEECPDHAAAWQTFQTSEMLANLCSLCSHTHTPKNTTEEMVEKYFPCCDEFRLLERIAKPRQIWQLFQVLSLTLCGVLCLYLSPAGVHNTCCMCVHPHQSRAEQIHTGRDFHPLGHIHLTALSLVKKKMRAAAAFRENKEFPMRRD